MSKAGKKKGNSTTLSLTEFLGAMPSAPGGDQDWAAEDDSLALPTAPGELPTAPGALGGGPAGRPRKPLPTHPPFTAYVGNLNFDITSDDIGEFFFEVGKCNIVEPRILWDREADRSKGYGYVEFADVESLKAALDLDGFIIADRPVKVDVAEPRANESSRGSQRNSRYPDMPPREERAGGAINWRREAPPEWTPAEPVRGPPMRAGSGRGEPRGPSDRGTPRAGIDAPNPFDKFDRSAPRPSLFGDRPAPEAAAPAQRKKLDLAPRTKPVDPLPTPPVKKEEPTPKEPEAAPKPAPVKKANPFGAARPVDTTAKLRAIEEKIAAEKKAKEEEERKAKEAAAAAEAEAAGGAAEAADGKEPRASSRGPRSPSAPGRGARSFSNSRGGSASGARGARGHGAGAPGARPLLPESKPKYAWGESARAKREAEAATHGDGSGEFRTVGGRGGNARGPRGPARENNNNGAPRRQGRSPGPKRERRAEQQSEESAPAPADEDKTQEAPAAKDE